MAKSILDLHCHTVDSGHAYSTVKENIEIASKKGIKFLGVSDHAPNMPGSGHPFYFQNMYVIPRDVNGVKILRGIEANIIDFDGGIDVSDEISLKMDYMIASFHMPCITPGNIEQNTNSILKVMEHEKVKIIGHPDDSQYPIDYEKIVINAKEKNILLEVNNSSLNPNSYRRCAKENGAKMLKLCKEYGVRIILGSDAHICYSVGDFSNALELLKEVDFPDELVINYNEDEIIEFFRVDF
ncbi:phosphatase [Clostridioides mangenotii]|uniref:phosphatase n=1 Tax=Metaclostridioides mangenotii TaxID=1540 RepID=UPI001C107913|nr:phosphatase [Clostridioides mangenotii]MBU5307227.1 phosphatase [Clostridioides mangenotii]MCR1955329.1 phosphatase [Clostridioides mangenotii]